MTKQDRTAWMLAGALFFSLFFHLGNRVQLLSDLSALDAQAVPSHPGQVGRGARGPGDGGPACSACFVGWLLDRVPAQIVMGDRRGTDGARES